MSELFPEEETTKLSPRLQWMKRYGLKIEDYDCMQAPTMMPLRSVVCCMSTILRESCPGTGESEQEAIFDWAERNGIRLWNEEKGWE